MFDKVIYIKKIKELQEKGLLNSQEFDDLKKEILNSNESNGDIINRLIEGLEERKIKDTSSEDLSNIESLNEESLSINESIESNSKNKNILLGNSGIVLGIIAVGIAFFFIYNWNNKNTTVLNINSSSVDTTTKSPSSNLNQFNINVWLKKATGYNFNLDKSKISFDLSNYRTFDSIPSLNVLGSIDNGVNNPIINYFNDYILIEFDNGWKHKIYVTSKLVVNSIHYGSNGETELYNLNTKALNSVNYEITNINGNDADVKSSGHDDSGAYNSNSGKLNLITGVVSWENSNTTKNENVDYSSISEPKSEIISTKKDSSQAVQKTNFVKSHTVIERSTRNNEVNRLSYIEGIRIDYSNDGNFKLKSFDFLSTVFGENSCFANIGEFDEAKFRPSKLEKEFDGDGYHYKQYIGQLFLTTRCGIKTHESRITFISKANDNNTIGIRLGMRGIYSLYTINF